MIICICDVLNSFSMVKKLVRESVFKVGDVF